MIKSKLRSNSNISQKKKKSNLQINNKYNETNPKDNKYKKSMKKTISESSMSNTSNLSSKNSNSSKMKKVKSKINEKEKSRIEDKKEQEKEKIIDNELVKKQYKIIKDFLIPILKEQNAKELVSYYNKMTKDKKKLKKSKTTSLKNKPILEYSFVTGKYKNGIKIPLFQILFPKQYQEHLDKMTKEKNISNNRPCRNIDSINRNNINISNSKGIKNFSNKLSSRENTGRKTLNNNKENNINIDIKTPNKKVKEIKSSLIINSGNKKNNNYSPKNKNPNEIESKRKNNDYKSISIGNKKSNKYKMNNNRENRAKTPPLYLRLKEERIKHDEMMKELRKKYEFNYNKNHTRNNNNSYLDLSVTSSSVKSKNKTQDKYDFEKWYNYEKTWMKMKDMKLNIIKSEIEENKTCMNLYNRQQETFKPKINKNSEFLASKYYEGDFYIRLKNYQKNKERKAEMLKEKLKPKFKPYVNVNYNINKEYYLYMNYDQKKLNRDLNEFLAKN